MPVTLDADHPSAVRIRHRAGDHLGTIEVVQEGHAWEAPVAFGAYRVIPDYRALAAAVVARACPEGGLARVLPSGGGLGDDRVLPVVEVVISPDGGTLGEALVRQGWAVPDAQALAHHAHADGYWRALAEARADGRGIWGEAGVDAATLGIPADQARATAPPDHLPAIWHALGMVVLIAALVLVALRRGQERAMPPPPLPLRGVAGRALRLAEIGVGLLRGSIPPRSSVPPVPPAPRAPRAPRSGSP